MDKLCERLMPRDQAIGQARELRSGHIFPRFDLVRQFLCTLIANRVASGLVAQELRTRRRTLLRLACGRKLGQKTPSACRVGAQRFGQRGLRFRPRMHRRAPGAVAPPRERSTP